MTKFHSNSEPNKRQGNNSNLDLPCWRSRHIQKANKTLNIYFLTFGTYYFDLPQ